ncbi:cell wall hydrolase [Microvirga mediterraneensis]|uniref:Cell wall hydrolase n=1 Tax=Microvirga mediterraneensis TaxID=2754695 RepID=A0A838BMN5_9HYPH|nr:cell wall hydrolase [Microvirga mediterraneensis]MBA1156934.1 cell wall hydrolase [Microvirga mediterraneensis]
MANYGPALLDFSPIANLGNTFLKARREAQEHEQKQQIRQTLASLGTGERSYDDIGKTLLSLGELNGGLGFLKLGQEEKLRGAQAAADREAYRLIGGGAPTYSTSTGTPRANIDNGVHVAETEEDVQRLERAMGQNTAPDLDKVVRTVYGEAGNQGAIGQAAVANVIANRAQQSGMTPTDVVLAKGQFEPWSDPAARARMESLDPNSPEYKQIAEIAQNALSGRGADPTGGADHFYAPKAQAALGRSAPAWDNGSGRDIGDHRFFRLGYGPQGPVQVAQADIPAAGAREAQGFAIPGQAQEAAQSPRIANLERALANPNLSENARRTLQARLDREYKLFDEARKPNVTTQVINGRVVLVDQNARTAMDITPEGLPSGYRPMTAQEKQAFGIPENTGAMIGPDGKPASLPGTASTKVELPKAETKYDEGQGKDYSDLMTSLQKAGRSAAGTKNTLRLMARLTEDENFYSGFNGERALTAKKFLASLGVVDPKATAPTEVFSSLVNDVVLGKLGGSLGAGVSNSDVGFLQSTAPNLANTREGNRLLIAITEKMMDRQHAVAKLARDYAKNNGGRLDVGFEDEPATWADQNPLFTEQDFQAAPAAMNGSPVGRTALSPLNPGEKREVRPGVTIQRLQ